MFLLLLWLYAWVATGISQQDAPSAEALLQRARQQGTPLVDRIEGDGQYVLVTFVWSGTAETKNIVVVGTFLKAPVVAMTRIAGSDLWYLTTSVPARARFTYWLAENSPMVTEGPQVGAMLAALQADPLNPNRTCPAGAPLQGCKSTVELPGAPPQPWIVRNASTPAGQIADYSLKSERLNNERTVSVYTPAGYRASGEPYALMVVFDRGAYLTAVPTPTILDNLIAASRIPPTVAVFLDNPNQATRTRELTPNPDFTEFLVSEMLPWVHARYNVTTNPHRTVVAGSSFGGLAATYAALRHPERFGNVLCQSGDFSWAPDHIHVMGRLADATTETGWFAKEFIRSPKLPIRFYMDAGTFEVDQVGTGGHVLETSRHMRDVLLAKGYEVHYQQFVGGHDPLSWRGTLAEGLIRLIGL
jgi:enterochelin esterase family protein